MNNHGDALPAPSQDAEGDGRHWHNGLEQLARDYAEARIYDDKHGTISRSASAWESMMIGFKAHCVEHESAIREPYEALVKAARDAQSALVLLTSELSGQMGYIEGLQQRPHGQAQRVINSGHEAHAFLTAALTRIEESLGGRKDG